MEAALTSTDTGRAGRLSFLLKLVAAAYLVTLADWLFFFQRLGATLGLFAGALLVALLLTRPPLRRGAARTAIGAAFVLAFALVDDPSLLAICLFWTAASLAVLLPRAGFDDGWRWAKRLLIHWLCLPFGPVEDAWRLRAARRRRGAFGFGARLPTIWLPLIGSLLFLALFAAANPVIGDALAGLDLVAALTSLSLARLSFWIVATMLAWSLVRPRRVRLAPSRAAAGDIGLPGFSPASVTLSLFAFNAVFALQNGLDIAFLWSGAPLPHGMTLAEYAHRGAYPLIATALLAGLFVLVTLRPGSAMAESATLRRLVYAWIAQNVLLVASTMLRTVDYVDAYSLTRLRIAALAWMGLVAIGLLLICWRIWRRRSGAWLINANLAAAALLLAACAFVDLGAVAARWNVTHAREIGGRGARLDLCYLNALGASSLSSLVELESRPLPPALRDRVAWLRNLQMDRLQDDQADWHGWTWRGERRLASADARIAERRLPRFSAGIRDCAGTPVAPPPPIQPPAPLTGPSRE
jgi:hypothetical protein